MSRLGSPDVHNPEGRSTGNAGKASGVCSTAGGSGTPLEGTTGNSGRRGCSYTGG